MKQKYLVLALSAIFTTGLVGCGSDSDSNYIPPNSNTPETPDTDAPDTDAPDTDAPDTDAPDTDAPDTDAPDTDEGPVKGDIEDNVGEAATDPNADSPTVGGQQYVRSDKAKFDRELNPATKNNGNATVINSKELQNKKLDNIVLGRESVERKGVKESLLRYAGEAVDGFSDKNSADTKGLQEYNVANGVNVTSADNNLNGLVSIKRDNGVYTVEGQENTVGGIAAYNTTGSTLSTRIFGNKSLDTNNAAAVNSTSFVGTENAKKELNINSLNDTAKFKDIKLNNVQYGRVTSNIDKLAEGELKDGIKYYESNIVAKGTDGSVDTYFYRGTGETSIAQMNALQEKGGTFNYAGSALMYGIDNSYHGDLGDPDSNSFGGTDLPVEGKGNFVNATVDMDKKTVSGNVFNVWEVSPTEGGNVFRQDNVVDFKGDIFGNTAKGDANLSYDKKNTGAFKGSFFGKNAEEFGGSLNSVDKGYGNSAWGGVFGTQQVGVTVPEDGNANQTE